MSGYHLLSGCHEAYLQGESAPAGAVNPYDQKTQWAQWNQWREGAESRRIEHLDSMPRGSWLVCNEG